MQYFATGIQGCIKKLREALTGKTAEELKSEDNKLKVVALKTTSNINVLIKDLFHSPPSFKSMISLSWKPLGATVSIIAVSLQRKFSPLLKVNIKFIENVFPKKNHFNSSVGKNFISIVNSIITEDFFERQR